MLVMRWCLPTRVELKRAGWKESIFREPVGSNGVAAILTMTFPIIGYFFVFNPLRWSRILSFLSAPLILDAVLRCNSRGAYLAAAISGIVLLYFARGRSRKLAALVMVLGIAAFLIQARNSGIWERMFSITASAEERDHSASGRIEYWKAGVEMFQDHPLGSGGQSAFKSPLGMQYIQHFIDAGDFRSVHNGYLSIAAGWGVQGFAVYAGALLVACLAVWRALRTQETYGNEQTIFLGTAFVAALAGPGGNHHVW